MNNNGIKECFVAFVDILGFSEMIRKDNGTGEYLSIIKNAIEASTKRLRERKSDINNPYKFWFDEFKVKSFSDCFCFSIPLEFDNGEKDYKQNFVSFYIWLKVFYNELLANGFLCRGGVTQGWHYNDDNIIFSNALIEAYLLESKKATHPMFLIHPNLIKELQQRDFSNEKYYDFMFSHDNAGKCFLNPFNYSIVDEIFFGLNSPDGVGKFISERNDLISAFLKIINLKIDELKGENAVDKWQWIKEFSLFTLEGKYNDKFYKGLNW